MIRILIVHEVSLVADLKATALAGEPDMKVVGCVQTVEDAFGQLKRHPCDVVLASVNLPNQGALKLTRHLVQSDHCAKVIITGLSDSRETILHCVEEGAAGYLLHEESLASLVKKIRAVSEDEFMVSPSIAAALIARVAELKQMARMFNGLTTSELETQVSEVTTREWEVLRLIEKGLSNQEIADALDIKIGTVKNHLHNLFSKLGVQNRRQAAMVARRLMTDKSAMADMQSIPERLPAYVPSRSMASSRAAQYSSSRFSRR